MIFLNNWSIFYSDIFFFFFSNLNRANLKEACEASGIDMLVPTRVGGTRWVPHTLQAVSNIWRTYPALVLHLSQVSFYKYRLAQVLVYLFKFLIQYKKFQSIIKNLS